MAEEHLTLPILLIMNPISRHTAAIASLTKAIVPECCPKIIPGSRELSIATTTSIKDRKKIPTSEISNEHIIILGGGIAGLSTARYILGHTQKNKNVKVTLIDRNADILPAESSCSSSYEEQMCSRLHLSIPSRRNGNVLCPSLTVPWTTRPLWKEAVLPGLKSIISSHSCDNASSTPSITFDWPSLIGDKKMWSFGVHFFLQKLFLGRPEHESNKSILEYNMKCLDDPSDELVQSIEYGRWAKGTKLLDGTTNDIDSSGDIGLFCRGLLYKLLRKYDDRFTVVSGEQISMLQVSGEAVLGVDTVDGKGNKTSQKADKIVMALGLNSTSLCKDINVPCPVYPVKGHLVTVSSKVDCAYNLTLEGGVGYAAPMAHVDSEGRRLYRLSGFVDFTPGNSVDQNRVNALVKAAKKSLPDLQIIDTSACHRPFSADDRPLIGPTGRYPNLYLCTGFGSRGWSIGLASGKVVASQILGIPSRIDPAPYLPSRFIELQTIIVSD